jgi:hypothetical protein
MHTLIERQCVICNRKFQNLKRHEETNAHRKRLNDSIIASSFFYCNWCNMEVDYIGVHEDSNVHFENKFECMRGDIKKAVNNTCAEHIYHDIRTIDPKLFLKNITSEVIQVGQSKFDNINLQLNFQVEFYKLKLGSEKIYNTGWFNPNRFMNFQGIT